MTKVTLKLHHCGISVANMEESIEWYGRVLGFQLMWQKDFPEIKTKIAFLANRKLKLELFEAYESQPLPEERRLPITDLKKQGTKHIAFDVKDIKKLFADFRDKGVDIVFGPVESPPKDALFGFVRDPSGVLIEIIEMYP